MEALKLHPLLGNKFPHMADKDLSSSHERRDLEHCPWTREKADFSFPNERMSVNLLLAAGGNLCETPAQLTPVCKKASRN